MLAPISGPVSRILVPLGALVGRGQPLATTVSPDFAAAVSAYRKAAATATNPRRIADLDAQLFENDAIARREMEQAETDAVSAEADRDAALQQLRSLGVGEEAIEELRAGRSDRRASGVIRSPLAGTVVERLITPGQLLQAGTTPCFTVADLSTVWVMANVFEADLPFVAVGDPADVTTTASRETLSGHGGQHLRAGRSEHPCDRRPHRDAATRARRSRRTCTSGSRSTRGRRAPAVLLPVSAVLRDDANLPFVFVENADGSFGRRRVTLGDRAGDR